MQYPYVRSPRGTRTRFLPTKVAATISRAYSLAHGADVARWRTKVIEHTDRIVAHLMTTFGNDPSLEWERVEIRRAVEQELRKHASSAVQEAFFELHPLRPATRVPMQTTPRPWTDPTKLTWRTELEELDPSWNMIVMREPIDPTETANDLMTLGKPLQPKKKPRFRKNAGLLRPVHVPWRRSQWLAWWRSLLPRVGHGVDFEALERAAKAHSSGPLTLDSAAWWHVWRDILFRSMERDPRLFGLLRVAQQRWDLAQVVGQDWLDGSGLNETTGDESRSFLLHDHAKSTQFYRALWLENAQRLATHPGMHSAWGSRYDLVKLARRLDPDRDALIDWRGQHRLLSGGCLWRLPQGHRWTVASGLQVGIDAHEPPQWAWMRLAMAMALHETHPEEAVVQFYEHLSTLSLVPSETMLRQAGRQQPNFLDDAATRVSDRFESVHDAIHRAAVGTKWTGTISLDWGAVRAAGSPIGGGRRRSSGLLHFLRMIDSAMVSQGRLGEDRPVTVMLPIWHRETDLFVQSWASTPRLQTVLMISDLFMERVQTHGSWTLFDPGVFPEVLDGTPEGYLAAEAAVPTRKSAHPNACRVVSADRLWRKIVSTSSKEGLPFLCFSDALRAFEPFPVDAPSMRGVDGVGGLPLPRPSAATPMPWLAWPSMAVNLASIVDPQSGQPDLKRLQTLTEMALRMLDNAISASESQHTPAVLAYRSVCLGAVGLDEAVARATVKMEHESVWQTRWMETLAEAWASALLAADQQLRKERGAAPAWAAPRPADAQTFDPLGGVQRLQRQRRGVMSTPLQTTQDWSTTAERLALTGHRCSVRSVWAPFAHLAAIAGVTPGGIGPVRPVDHVLDEQGVGRWVPTPALLQRAKDDPSNLATWRQPMHHPRNPRRWPAVLQGVMSHNVEDWRPRLLQAAGIQPWIDQGISVTLPTGVPPLQLATMLHQIWWLGLPSVRFEPLVSAIVEENWASDDASLDEPDGAKSVSET